MFLDDVGTWLLLHVAECGLGSDDAEINVCTGNGFLKCSCGHVVVSLIKRVLMQCLSFCIKLLTFYHFIKTYKVTI